MVIAYYVIGVPLTCCALISMAVLLKSGRWPSFAGVCGLLAVAIAFSAGRRWVREKDQQMVQRARDQRAQQIYDWLSTGEEPALPYPYTLFLRPFASTGRLRIPLRSVLRKRPLMAGPSVGALDPEVGDTFRYKRYVSFGDFETELAALVEAYAPLIAIGNTGEQIGAGRVECHDSDWQTRLALLAEHAAVIFLVPSTHEGVQWEIARILDNARLVSKTVLFVPPADTVLGWDVGPDTEIGSRKGPVGQFDLRGDAIKAIAKLIPRAPVASIKRDAYGALLRLANHDSPASYHPLRLKKSFSFGLGMVGSNLHLDRAHLRCEVEEIMRLAGVDKSP